MYTEINFLLSKYNIYWLYCKIFFFFTVLHFTDNIIRRYSFGMDIVRNFKIFGSGIAGEKN